MRQVTIRDTLSGEERTLEPKEPGRVGIYACGPTTYGRIHVGNARPYVVFSLLKRFLEHEGYEATLVVNVTDINDKIYVAAREQGVASDEWARRMTGDYVADTSRLGLGRPDAEPLASETIAEIVDLIEALIERGHAYESGGDVYFRVRSFSGYGKLSNNRPEDMDQGEEAGSAQLKEDPLDFALWKATKADEDTAWDSPWGRGRPGWHIECSAMAEKLLGLDFAIHGGGSDLVFPHHENEIAQTEAGRGEPLARIWMHNGMLQLDAEKMSKSVGNIFQLSEALDAFGAERLIAYMVAGHYRQPLEFSEAALEEAGGRLERIRNYLRTLPVGEGESTEGGSNEDVSSYLRIAKTSRHGELDPFLEARRDAFLDALADDFNTPRALAELFELINEGHKREIPGARAVLAEMLYLLGLESLLQEGLEAPDSAAERLLAEREEARAARDFSRADEIRDELARLGWEVRDTPDGAKLVRLDT
jgi:cysteinyl-tRNA synthetase